VKRIFFWPVLAAAALALGSAGEARGDGALTPAAKAQAQPRYKKGLELYARALRTQDSKDFEDSYLQFVQAFSIYPDDKVLWNLAIAENDTNRLIDALHHFRTFEEHQHALEQEKHPQHAALREYLETLKGKTSQVGVDAPLGARIQVDGHPAGVAPLSVPVDVLPGVHDVSTNVNGAVAHASVDAVAGTQKNVRLGFVDEAPTPTAPVATVPTVAPLPPVASNDDKTPTENRSFFTPRNTTVLAVGVGTVAALVAAGVFKLGANSQHNTETTLGTQTGNCPGSSACAQLSQAESDRVHDDNAAAAFLIVGGALALTDVGMLLLWHDAPTDRSNGAFRFAPLISPTTAGAQLSGTF
jgi:hypothetical protein